MPTDEEIEEAKKLKEAREKADEAWQKELDHMSNLGAAAELLGKIVDAPRREHLSSVDSFAATLNDCWMSLHAKIRAENQKIEGKRKAFALTSSIDTADTRQRVRKRIQHLIDKEQKEKDEHLKRALELLQQLQHADAGVGLEASVFEEGKKALEKSGK
jgi:hypothetical protein